MLLQPENNDSNKELQRKRIISYFIEATCKIIDEEGIDNVTARKVAALAGYNSATLYNYFENLNHLIFFSSLRYLKDYASDLPNYVLHVTDTIETYIQVWRCFSLHSYLQPKFYKMIFFGNFDHTMVNNSVLLYYSIFADEITDDIKRFIPMFVESDIYKRDYELLKKAADEKIILPEHVREINEMNVLIYRGMLDKMFSATNKMTAEEAVATTVRYVKRTLISFGVNIELD